MRQSPSDRAAIGRKAREIVPRSALGEWVAPADRTDPLAILRLQATTRVESLVPLRFGRMAASPFAFFRGAAAVMAADLARDPHTSLEAQLCGDAHLVNFGGFRSPERDMVFDVNDFDETLPGPFEWDLKRLAASIEVAARDREADAKTAQHLVRLAMAEYRSAMAEFAGMSNLAIWYQRMDAQMIFDRYGSEAGDDILARFMAAAEKAQRKDQLKAAAKLTHEVDGQLRFLADPPLLVPAADIVDDFYGPTAQRRFADGLMLYGKSLNRDRAALMDRYEFMDLARKVVGVGSVGTRCWVALFVGRDFGDPLVLQVKQAEASVLEPFLAPSAYGNHGQRVVEGQRLMQGASDIFLGWDRVELAEGDTRDFYFRQLWDAKLSAQVETMPVDALGFYVRMCGWTLARAHARSGDPIAISAYLGSSDRFDTAMARFASAYADQNEVDHAALKSAIANGRIGAIQGV